MHVRCDNQYKTGADRGNILGQPMLFECMGICVLSPAHEKKKKEGLPCLCADCKILISLILFKFSHNTRLDGLIVEVFGDFLKHF